MSIHYAAARPFLSGVLASAANSRIATRAANDNGRLDLFDNLLRDALKHFAAHGINAAEDARERAERAFFSNDRAAYRRWLGICRTLDRRMAAALAAQMTSQDA